MPHFDLAAAEIACQLGAEECILCQENKLMRIIGLSVWVCCLTVSSSRADDVPRKIHAPPGRVQTSVWRMGKRTPAWTKTLPLTPDGESKGKPLSAESVAVVGDYLFVGMCKPQDNRQYVHILAIKVAGYIGSFWPGDSVGGQAGWLDMPYALQGLKRKDGEYLLLVEEDFRGKNLLYRWTPSH